MSASPSLFDLVKLHSAESASIRQAFETSGDGKAAATRRSSLVDSIIERLWQEFVSSELHEPAGLALLALGGYGRKLLLPHSDVDLLFLTEAEKPDPKVQDRIRKFNQELWDLRLRVSSSTRPMSECARLNSENVEFTISLLDCRWLAGDQKLFDKLHDQLIPALVKRDGQNVVQLLSEVTRKRHEKFSDTIFHLEPNLKESPGGVRDFNVANWLSLISSLEKNRKWPSDANLLPAANRELVENAFDFLLSVRCFLHYRYGRDDNNLSWDAQDDAAAKAIGIPGHTETLAADWMRAYFRHARVIDRLTTQLLDEAPPAAGSLYQKFQRWRSRVSNSDFTVENGRILLQPTASPIDTAFVFRTFEFMAKNGFRLGSETEQRLSEAIATLDSKALRTHSLWTHLKHILAAPFAADALRTMHSLGFLVKLFPDYQLIDSLVIRDFYHRYTVDEHTFLTVESLHHLLERPGKEPPNEWEHYFSDLVKELEQPELLYLSLLFHDIGKGLPGDSHVAAGLPVMERSLRGIGVHQEELETVRFLITEHLAMSATLRRDIFDHETVRAFADKIGTPERLKMLCLMTYADIRSVNPEALTPWKAESLWRLYMAAANYMNRSVDDDRFHAEFEAETLTRIGELVPKKSAELQKYLEGLPHRYLRTHSPIQIAKHFEMSVALAKKPVQISLKHTRGLYELTLLTGDRPLVFATIAGVLSAWGMNIVKANAFANQAGTIVDTFYFKDRFRTLELNPPELDRFERSIVQVLSGEVSLHKLLEGRGRTPTNGPTKPQVTTRLDFNNHSSSHSTLLELIAQDRPGLLYKIASTLGRYGCNIEVALIDTEGHVAIDVFYLTWECAKLTGEHQFQIRRALLEELEPE
jgi:[protein-PII] uridylyltransferase